MEGLEHAGNRLQREHPMHPYVVLLILSALMSAVHAGAMLVQDAPRRSNVLAAGVLGCAAFWSLCQVMWNTTDDASTALFYMRLSALGWIPIAPVAIHLVLTALPEAHRRASPVLPWLYATCAIFVVVAWTTSWIQKGAVATPWGWSYVLGSGFVITYLFIIAVAGAAVALGLRAGHSPHSPAEANQMRLIAKALMVPIVVGSVTDGILPLMEISFPPLGSVSVTFLGIVTAWSMHRYGYSILVPYAFTREILETLPDGIILLYLDGRIRSCNEPLTRLAELEPGDELDGSVDAILSLPTHELASELRNVECKLITSSGARIPVTVSTRMLRDRQQMGIGIIVVVHDQRELDDLRNRLIVSGRLAAVGELAAGVAHEINNPLTYVRANLSLMRQHWAVMADALMRSPESQDESLREVLREGGELFGESLEGVDRATSIIRDIKGLSYAGSGSHKDADVNLVLDGVLRIAAPQIPNTVTIRRDYSELPMIPCAQQELSQVFLNLVLNAAQSIQGAGEIFIATSVEEGSIVVRVVDSGCGISPEAASRIFDPFFTTKDMGEGTGLGLAISHEIVRQHDGEIRFESPEAGGSEFRVRLPIEIAGSSESGD